MKAFKLAVWGIFYGKNPLAHRKCVFLCHQKQHCLYGINRTGAWADTTIYRNSAFINRKTEGRLHHIAQSVWLTGDTWDVMAWLLCNQDVAKINFKNRNFLFLSGVRQITEMIFSMCVAATCFMEHLHNEWKSSVGDVCLAEWVLKSCLSARCLGLFRPCR